MSPVSHHGHTPGRGSEPTPHPLSVSPGLRSAQETSGFPLPLEVLTRQKDVLSLWELPA